MFNTLVSESQLAEDLKGLASEWEDLGVNIGIDFEDLKEIERNNNGRDNLVSHCFNNIIHAWFEGDPDLVNTETLARAVELADFKRLATKIRENPGRA